MSILNETNRKWWILAGVSIASFLGCIDFTIVNTALPAIQTSLQAGVTELQWIINIFILALSTCMVIMGRLADIYGRRLVLYIGMIVFGISSLGAGLSINISWLILFRLIQGISCAVLYTASGAIIANAFPINERGKAIGTLFGINGIGLAVGPVIGGIIVSALSWRWIFLVNVPVILISLIICFLSVKESRNEEEVNRIDWLGLITLIIALLSLILCITQGDAWGWSSPIIIGLLLLAIVTFISFYLIEMKVKTPIIQFQLFANRQFISSVVATFSLALFYCLAFFLMPLYLHNIFNETSYKVGLMLLPTTAMVAICSPIVGRLVDKFGPRSLLIAGFCLFILSALLQTQFSVNSSLFHIFAAFIFMGIGWACILGPSTVASLSAVPENKSAVAMGSSWTMHNIGGAIGLGVGVVIYHKFAMITLLNELTRNNIGMGIWVKDAVANPDNAIALFQQYTSLNHNEIVAVFHRFFISGYQAAMWLLCATSLIALVVMIVGVRKKR